ncbi:unnamed protein product [Heterosigma akashiwo]|uniref:Uncharacterized protein n=1 Tax=Heterosigma akashiwo TaxID=2829 RepID=A0A6S9KCF9_HETAK|mmetsp:Transcript_20963/g.28857  ORF Transcript_20963/g.28857 Transcript_20963/m.28857 type:complete len:317 (+) Transcript_20963:123-1073(+)
MGQCCSDVSSGQDPDDHCIDFYNLSVTKYSDADDFYDDCTTLLDEVVDIHNGVIDAIQNLTMAGATLKGAYRPMTFVTNGVVSVKTLDAEGNEFGMLETTSNQHKLSRDLLIEVEKTIETLNREELGKGLNVRSNIKLVGQNCADHTVAIFNRQIYMYAKSLMLQEGDISVGEYSRALKAALATQGKKVAFAVAVFEDGSLRIEASRFAASQVPPAARACLDALKVLEDEFRARAEDVPHLAMRLQYAADEAELLVNKMKLTLEHNPDHADLSQEALTLARANLEKILSGKEVIDRRLVTQMTQFGEVLKASLEDA